jgi:hypothetical protein
MFSYISKNWRGKPLLSRETVVELIGKTTNTAGLQIQAFLDENHYEEGISVSPEELDSVNLGRDSFHGEWNYWIEKTE